MKRAALAFLGLLRLISGGAAFALIGFIVLFFLCAGLKGFEDIDKFPAFKKVLAIEARIEAPALAAMKKNIPTKFRGQDISGILLVLGSFIMLGVVGRIDGKIQLRMSKLKKSLAPLGATKKKSSLQKSLKDMAEGKELDREKLLELMAETKKSLEKHKAHLAFLSVDIVNSTGMKIGEEASVSERDFRHYKAMVEKILQKHNSVKEAWTPDGIMIAFGTVRGAVLSGQEILIGLGHFNKEVKTIKHDFNVRIGINSGEVLFDEAVPMEEMSDRSIDIAGHMQKHAAHGSIWISEQSITPLLAELPFRKTEEVVDGCRVYEWTPSAAA